MILPKDTEFRKKQVPFMIFGLIPFCKLIL